MTKELEKDFDYCEDNEELDEEITDEEIQKESESLEEQLVEENITTKHKLDYTLQSPQERNELVTKIIEETPPEQLTPRYLEILSDYIIFAMDKEERKEKKILTSNRMVTVNKRETSFEGICASFENGEDGIYNILSDLGKNTILTPKDPITQEDIEKIPALKTLRENIVQMQEQYKKARGKKKFLLKKQIIEMQQDQYVIRNEYRGVWSNVNRGSSSKMAKSIAKVEFYDDIYFDENNEPVNDGVISFFNPDHVEALLCNYSGLKEVSYSQFRDDLYYLMWSFDNLVESALKDYPLYEKIVLYKIDGKQNLEIQYLIEKEFGIKHSVEYISSLWRNKIPKLIAEKAKEDEIMWYYTYVEYGKWKKCSRCGEIKLAHNRFFSKNKTSKDGYYSICKCCRNAKSKKK